jgi:LmbE family N-acetylglucosaminyl deacetylase
MLLTADKIDVLVIGAHPDDAEIGAGGFLLNAKNNGYSTGIISISDGSAGAYGNSIQRLQEAENAAAVLKIDILQFLEMQDLNINFETTVQKLEDILVSLRPRLILTHCSEDWHPDHRQVWQMVDMAWALAARISRHGKDHIERPQILHFSTDILRTHKPDILIDISPYAEEKQQALLCHVSQREIVKNILAFNALWGSAIRTLYAEPFFTYEPLILNSSLGLL